MQVAPALVDVLAELGVGVGHLAVHGQVHEVLALVVGERALHEAELDRGLLHALGEVALVEREPQLAVLEDVVGAGFVVAASRGVHSLTAGCGGTRPPGERRHSRSVSFTDATVCNGDCTTPQDPTPPLGAPWQRGSRWASSTSRTSRWYWPERSS